VVIAVADWSDQYLAVIIRDLAYGERMCTPSERWAIAPQVRLGARQEVCCDRESVEEGGTWWSALEGWWALVGAGVGWDEGA